MCFAFVPVPVRVDNVTGGAVRVQATLQRLDLSPNRELQIDQASFDTPLSLPLLESLDIQAAEPGMEGSACLLARLPATCQQLRTGASAPALIL